MIITNICNDDAELTNIFNNKKNNIDFDFNLYINDFLECITFTIKKYFNKLKINKKFIGFKNEFKKCPNDKTYMSLILFFRCFEKKNLYLKLVKNITKFIVNTFFCNQRDKHENNKITKIIYKILMCIIYNIFTNAYYDDNYVVVYNNSLDDNFTETNILHTNSYTNYRNKMIQYPSKLVKDVILCKPYIYENACYNNVLFVNPVGTWNSVNSDVYVTGEF